MNIQALQQGFFEKCASENLPFEQALELWKIANALMGYGNQPSLGANMGMGAPVGMPGMPGANPFPMSMGTTGGNPAGPKPMAQPPAKKTASKSAKKSESK